MNRRLIFLDGLRGWGAVSVVLYHAFVEGLPVTASSAATLRHLAFFSAMPAVLIFFLVSGFSLSVRYLADGDVSAWSRIAAGRYIRLAIPVFAACLLVHLGMLGGLIAPGSGRPAPFTDYLNFEPTTSHLLSFGLLGVFFDYRPTDSYIGPLWTMSIEMAGSVLALAAVLAVRPFRYRLALLLALATLLAVAPLSDNGSLVSLFVVGAFLADAFHRGWLDHVARPVSHALLIAGCLIVAIWPLSLGWGEIGSIALMTGCLSEPSIRAALNSKLSAWLGKVSFPLYLMHGPVFWAIGEPMTRHHLGRSVEARIGIDLLTIALSFAAALAFVPVNNLAIHLARVTGRAVTSARRRACP